MQMFGLCREGNHVAVEWSTFLVYHVGVVPSYVWCDFASEESSETNAVICRLFLSAGFGFVGVRWNSIDSSLIVHFTPDIPINWPL